MARSASGRLVALLMVAAPACDSPPAPPTPAAPPPTIGAAPAPRDVESLLRLPRKAGSVRFAAIGDAGRGNRPQYEVSAQMQAYRKAFSFDFVLMLGDNVYDGGTARDYEEKFERPYKPLLDAGVRFYATIGNHDDPDQPLYKPFHMDGHRYYTFRPPSVLSRLFGADVQFFMVDTENLDYTQRDWLDRELGASTAEWKIPVFHRPIYTSGRYSIQARFLRSWLEPAFLRHGVTVAFSGHEHFYERLRPQKGITYFISGAAGSLRVGDIRTGFLTDVGFDRDYHFMLIEIDDKSLYFQAIARDGRTVDSGVLQRPADDGTTIGRPGPPQSPAPSP